MATGKCKYVDFIQDARCAVNNMIVMLYDGEDRMKVKESPYLEYGLADFKYSFDLKATYNYFVNDYLLTAQRGIRNTILTDLKLYAGSFRRMTDKWFSTFTDGMLGGETNELSEPDRVLRTICIENINTLTQLADKMVFVYAVLNAYPVNIDGEVDFNNAVKYIHSDLSTPSREMLHPIPISVLRFLQMVDIYRTNFDTYYAAYCARYNASFKAVANNFNLAK
ncbi:hypothetical protein D5b_00466 [Faustovirus]|nr:hypothetical protein D5b_00466 [Faustovirus]AMN84453.1 hypothetical protein D6_00042 [Faustovirus]AMP44405.1 hypothetical protein PRJ_Dakar_00454 [Faustovirus]QKE50150.1 hypothetical protein F-VV10_0030 [Faustovirus]